MHLTRPLLLCLIFLFQKTAAQTLTQSELPIVQINTNGETILNEPKITADMAIIYNGPGMISHIADPPSVYQGKIGIEIRGASSAWMPQQPFALETRDEQGNERTIAPFGMPEESDWCLIPHYNEKTFARNPLSYELFRAMGQYAPRTQLVEVVLNGNYEGIYLFCERIKRDKNRVDVAKADPNATNGDALTGGYIFKIDYWSGFDNFASAYTPAGTNAEINYVVHYPKADDWTTAQRVYLQQYVYNAETALFGPDFMDPQMGYRRYFDVESFVAYFLVNELARNNDGSKKSRYFHKNQNSTDSLIKAGPVWDFDWAWKDIPECDIFGATDGSGWSYRINDCFPDIYSPDLYPRMLQDSDFAQQVCNSYAELRQSVFSKEYLFHYVDSIAALVNNAKTRHYQRWNILGYQNWTVEAGGYPTTYAGEITKLKGWIERRLNWLDIHIPQLCKPADVPILPVDARFTVFPNPTNGLVAWNAYANPSGKFWCADVLGRTHVLFATQTAGRYILDLSTLHPGTYFIWSDGTKKDAARVVKY